MAASIAAMRKRFEERLPQALGVDLNLVRAGVAKPLGNGHTAIIERFRSRALCTNYRFAES
jgi:hypothetical protein